MLGASSAKTQGGRREANAQAAREACGSATHSTRDSKRGVGEQVGGGNYDHQCYFFYYYYYY
eukprot:16171376-Heterocapsa_arctica.AAC.1